MDGPSLTCVVLDESGSIETTGTYYPFSLAIAISTVYNWTLSCITDPLQDGRLSRICSSYDEDSESDVWNLRAGLIGTHWNDGSQESNLVSS